MPCGPLLPCTYPPPGSISSAASQPCTPIAAELTYNEMAAEIVSIEKTKAIEDHLIENVKYIQDLQLIVNELRACQYEDVRESGELQNDLEELSGISTDKRPPPIRTIFLRSMLS